MADKPQLKYGAFFVLAVVSLYKTTNIYVWYNIENEKMMNFEQLL